MHAHVVYIVVKKKSRNKNTRAAAFVYTRGPARSIIFEKEFL